MKMVNNRSSTAVIVLALLINFLSASTISLTRPSLYQPTNTTLSNPPGFPLILRFPPEPFRFNIIPYDAAHASIIFTNYGPTSPTLSRVDAIALLLDAMDKTITDIDQDRHHADAPVRGTRVFSHGSVKVTIEPQPQLTYTYLALWLSGLLQVGSIHGFVESDARFVDERANVGRTLGRARLGSV